VRNLIRDNDALQESGAQPADAAQSMSVRGNSRQIDRLCPESALTQIASNS